MKLTIPFELKYNVRGPLLKPSLRIGKNTSRISISQSCVDMMQLTKDSKLMIGLNESNKTWYIYEEKNGIKIQMHDKGERQQPIFVIVNSNLSRLLKKSFKVEWNATLLLFVNEPVKDNDGTYFKLSTL